MHECRQSKSLKTPMSQTINFNTFVAANIRCHGAETTKTETSHSFLCILCDLKTHSSPNVSLFLSLADHAV